MHKFRNPFLLLVISLTTVFFACNDKTSQLGLNLLPSGDRIQIDSIDTITVTSELVKPGEILSNSISQMVGSYNDPYFGHIEASFLTSLAIEPNYKDTIVNKTNVKSALMLDFNNASFIGDTTSELQFTVYKLKKNIEGIATYSNLNMNDYIDPVAIGSTVLKVGDSILFDTIYYKHRAIIPLSGEFTNSIISLPLKTLKNDTSRQRVLGVYGLYVETKLISKSGVIYTVSFSDVDIYGDYSNKLVITSDKKYIEFSLFNAKYNQFVRDYVDSIPKANLVVHSFNPIDKKNDSIYPVMSAGGVKIKLNFSNLLKLKRKDNKVLNIYSALLYVPYDTLSYINSKTKIPSAINFQMNVQCSDDSIVYPYSSASTNPKQKGFKPYNDSYVRYGLNTKTSTNIFNISQFVQEYLSGNTKVTDLYIFPYLSNKALSCAFLKNHKHMKLKIKYSIQ